MPRYVAFLRGVSPVNAQMPALRQALECAGFSNVRSVLASGNLVFDATADDESALEPQVEAALQARLGRSFYTIVRATAALQDLLARDPHVGVAYPPGTKFVVSFLRQARPPRVALPLTEGQATVIAQSGRHVFSAYVPGPEGPVFMKLIERAFGTEVTTRTWDTVRKCSLA